MMHHAGIEMNKIYIFLSNSRSFSLAKFKGSRKGKEFMKKINVTTIMEYHEFLAINSLYDIIALKNL